MNLNIFILFDGALMFAGLQILMIWKGKKKQPLVCEEWAA